MAKLIVKTIWILLAGCALGQQHEANDDLMPGAPAPGEDLRGNLTAHNILHEKMMAMAKYTSTALTFELPDNERTCFYERYPGSKGYVFKYKVIRGGNLDVDVFLASPNGKILYKETKMKTGSFAFTTSRGDFKVCFSNEFSTISHKTVYFELRPEDMDTLAFEAGKMIPSVNTQVEASLESLHRYSTLTVEFQKAYRLNEAKGRHMADVLNTRVQMWSVIEASIIMATGVGQVLLLKTFFTEKRKLPSNKGPTA